MVPKVPCSVEGPRSIRSFMVDKNCHIGVLYRPMSHCVVCNEEVAARLGSMCQACLAAKVLIQRSAYAMMTLHGIAKPTGLCVDCGVRPATCRDHRLYGSPLKVDFVCLWCNRRRGPALDLFPLIKAYRGSLLAQ